MHPLGILTATVLECASNENTQQMDLERSNKNILLNHLANFRRVQTTDALTLLHRVKQILPSSLHYL